MPRATETSGTSFSLPHIDDRSVPGASLVHRAVSIVLLCFGSLVVLAVLALQFVTFPVVVNAGGLIEPENVYPIRAQQSGWISRVLVSEGDTVRTGQPLLLLDSLQPSIALVDIQLKLEAKRTEAEQQAKTHPIEHDLAEAAVLQAKARLLRAQAAFRQRLTDFGVQSHAWDSVAASHIRGAHVGIDAAQADVEIALAEEAAAYAQLARSRLAPQRSTIQKLEIEQLLNQQQLYRTVLGRSVIRAPSDGIVLTEQVELRSSSSIREGDTILELASLGNWIAVVSVAERDIHRIRLGDSARLELPALAGIEAEPFLAKVSRISQVPASSGGLNDPMGANPQTRHGRYRVVLAIDRAQLDSVGPQLIRRGYSTQAKILTGHVRVSSLLISWLRDRMDQR